MLIVLEGKKRNVEFIACRIFASIWSNILLEFIVVYLIEDFAKSIVIVNNSRNYKVLGDNLHFFRKMNFRYRLVAFIINSEAPFIDYGFIADGIPEGEGHFVVYWSFCGSNPHVRQLVVQCAQRVCLFRSIHFISFIVLYFLYGNIFWMCKNFIRKLCLSTGTRILNLRHLSVIVNREYDCVFTVDYVWNFRKNKPYFRRRCILVENLMHIGNLSNSIDGTNRKWNVAVAHILERNVLPEFTCLVPEDFCPNNGIDRISFAVQLFLLNVGKGIFNGCNPVSVGSASCNNYAVLYKDHVFWVRKVYYRICTVHDKVYVRCKV